MCCCPLISIGVVGVGASCYDHAELVSSSRFDRPHARSILQCESERREMEMLRYIVDQLIDTEHFLERYRAPPAVERL